MDYDINVATGDFKFDIEDGFFNSDIFDTMFGVYSGIGSFLISLVILIFILIVISLIFIIIGKWKTFKKAGKGGWEALIPIYNTIVSCQISGITPWWVLITTVGTCCISLIPFLGNFVATIISLYFIIILNVSVAKSYGKGIGFGIGLWLLPPIFWMILGCGNNKYEGKLPVNDFFTNLVEDNKSSNKEEKVCLNCGVKVKKDDLYCPNCGKKL